MTRNQNIASLVFSHVAIAIVAVTWLNPCKPSRDRHPVVKTSIETHAAGYDTDYIVRFVTAGDSTFRAGSFATVDIDQNLRIVSIRRFEIPGGPFSGEWYGDSGDAVRVTAPEIFALAEGPGGTFDPDARATIRIQEPNGGWRTIGTVSPPVIKCRGSRRRSESDSR